MPLKLSSFQLSNENDRKSYTVTAVFKKGIQKTVHLFNGKDEPNEWLMAGTLGLTLGGLFFSTGNFGFLNIFDIRREVQIILIGLLLLFSPFIITRFKQWIFEPLWLMTATTLLAEIFIRQNQSIFFIFDRLAAVYVIALIFTFSLISTDRILRVIIILAACFSSLVIIQAVVIWHLPGVLDSFVLGYTSSTQGDKVDIGHPLEYFGLVSPGVMNLSGHPFPRFRSFATEPSALICTFLTPGILALGFRDSLRWCALPILLFCILLSTSGTIYLSLCFGLLAFGTIWIFNKWVKTLAILPLLLIPPWYWFVLKINSRDFFLYLTNLLAPLNSYYPVLTKTESGTVRLTSMANVLSRLYENWDQYLFGAPFFSTGGMILHMVSYSGIIGLVLILAVSIKIFRLIINTFSCGVLQQRIMAGFLYGLFFQVLSFSQYGWMNVSGFMMLALITRWLEFSQERKILYPS